MSNLRPECSVSTGSALDDATTLYLIRDAVARRRFLIHGRLHDGLGHHCAMGAFWADNPRAAVSSALIDEVATVNDSLGQGASAHERWKKVSGWLRWKIQVLAHGKAAA